MTLSDLTFTSYLKTYFNSDNLSGKDKIEDAFDKTSELLFSSCTLKNSNRKYKLTEIEFYLNCKSHPDKFTHEHKLPTGCWRFHESGIDITIGGNGFYGGILIRGIQYADQSKKPVDGPIAVFDELFNSGLKVEKDYDFSLLLSSNIKTSVRSYTVPRVGLKPKGRPEDKEFIMSPYRYLIYPEKAKQEKYLVFLGMVHNYSNDKKIQKIKIDESSKKYYQNYYDAGKKITDFELNQILTGKKKLNVEDKCKLYGKLNTNKNDH